MLPPGGLRLFLESPIVLKPFSLDYNKMLQQNAEVLLNLARKTEGLRLLFQHTVEKQTDKIRKLTVENLQVVDKLQRQQPQVSNLAMMKIQ